MSDTVEKQDLKIDEDFVDLLRDRIPAKSRGAAKGKTNRQPPAWRTNRSTELKALKKAFTRHGCVTFDKRMALINTMLDEFAAQTRYRRTTLDADEFVSQPRMLSVWLNQDGWQDEFERPSSELSRSSDGQCTHPHCSSRGCWRLETGALVCKQHYLETAPEIQDLNRVTLQLQTAHPRRDGESVRDWCFRLLSDKSLGRQLLQRWRGG
jgi:hypothetical protein